MNQILASWQLNSMSVPQQFIAFADAYLDSAERLCKVLRISTRKATYERGAVVLYLTFHSVELFLKAAILEQFPNEKLHHNIEHYNKRYRNLYPKKKYILDIPFQTKYLGFEPPEIKKLKKSQPSQEQINRYPIDKNGKKWNGAFAFDPDSFLREIYRLKSDFTRLKNLIFG